MGELLEELGEKNLFSEILLAHNSARTPGGDNILSSGVRIISILNIYMFVLLDDFE